jgi:hypothetical protein
MSKRLFRMSLTDRQAVHKQTILRQKLRLQKKQQEQEEQQNRRIEYQQSKTIPQWMSKPHKLFMSPLTISVVGNAHSLFENKYGDVIDKADIVIRFNGGVVINPESQGTKTSIIAHSQYLSQNDRMKWKSATSTLGFWDTQRWPERDRLKLVLGTKPSNGLIILERIRVNFPVSVVRLFGFDWKHTKTWYHKTEPDTCKHNYAGERRYCLKLIDEKGWELYR